MAVHPLVVPWVEALVVLSLEVALLVEFACLWVLAVACRLAEDL